MINGIVNAFSVSPEILQGEITELDADSDPSIISNQLYWLNKKKEVIIATRLLLTMANFTACYFDKISPGTAIGFSALIVFVSIHTSVGQSAEQDLINSIFHKAHKKIEGATKINASLLKGKDSDVLKLCDTAKIALKNQQKIACHSCEKALSDSSDNQPEVLLKIIVRTKGATKKILKELKQDLESHMLNSV